MASHFEKECCVRGYHVYQRVWDAAIGENLTCRREPTNESDRYAVAVMKDDTVIGHLPCIGHLPRVSKQQACKIMMRI